jgi:hypothetical protein
MGYKIPTLSLSTIGTYIPIFQYPLRCKAFPLTPFIFKLFPLPMNEFTAALVAVAASLTASGIARIDGVTFTFSTDPYGLSFPEMIPVSGIHPTLGLDLHYGTDRHRCKIPKMDHGTPPVSSNDALIFTMLLFSVLTKPLSTKLPMRSRQLLRHNNWTV